MTPFKQVLIEITRRTPCFNTTNKEWNLRKEEPAYDLGTMAGTAQDLGQVIRDHGGIENRRYPVLDTALEEEAGRIRRHPGLFALHLLRYNGKNNVKAALYDNALRLDRLLAYDGI